MSKKVKQLHHIETELLVPRPHHQAAIIRQRKVSKKSAKSQQKVSKKSAKSQQKVSKKSAIISQQKVSNY